MKPLVMLSTRYPDQQVLRSVAMQFGGQHVQYQVPYHSRAMAEEGIVIRLKDGVVTVKCGDLAAEAADYLFGEQT
jgi:hypothetical protein